MVEISQSLKFVNDILLTVSIDAALNEFLQDIRVVRPSFNTRSSIDMLRSVS